jgi:16S rRNA processing protein RimM
MTDDPASESPTFLVVGMLRRPHGVRGEMIMDVMTDFPERIQPGLLVFAGESYQPLHVRRCRGYANGLLVLFEEINDSEAAGLWRNALISIKTDTVPDLPEGEYYHHQVLGLRVVSDTGLELGKVTRILETGAHDVCIVRSEAGRELLIPMVDQFILQIDLAAGLMRVHLIEGMA